MTSSARSAQFCEFIPVEGRRHFCANLATKINDVLIALPTDESSAMNLLKCHGINYPQVRALAQSLNEIGIAASAAGRESL